MEFKLQLTRPQSPSSCQGENQGPSPSPLARQPSTASLPNKKPSRHQVVSLQKARLSYSLKRIKRRKKVNNPETVSEGVSLSQLPDSYKDLKRIHLEFKQFLNVVVEDLSVKMENLQKYKTSDSVTVTGHEKNFANLQMFMLTKYSNRIENFQTVSDQRVENICRAHNKQSSTDSVTNLVSKYSKSVSKMKRRMKDMIDVTDKYAVADIFDSINILNEASKDLDSLDCSHNTTRRSVVSLGGEERGQNISTISTISTRSDVTSLGQQRRSKTLRSLSDHLAVLRRTYL